MDYLLVFILLALVAEILGTMGGFGSSVFFIPIAGFFLDFHSVLGITAVFHVASNLSKIALFRHGFDKKLIIYLGIPATISVLIGAYFSKFIVSQNLDVILAIFLIILSLVFLIFQTIKLKPTITNSIVGGILSGGIAGLIGTGGAIRGLTLASFKLTPAVFIATSAVIDLAVDSGRGVVYYFNGYVHSHDLYLILLLVLTSFLGTYLGKLLLKKVSEVVFRRMVLVLILITGVGTILKVMFS